MIASADPQATLADSPGATSKRDYISYSAIRTYQSCPLRYYFRYIVGLPEQTTAASLVFGSALHRALEFHFRQLLAGEPSPTMADLLAQYQLGWEERNAAQVRFSSSETRGSLDQLATKMLVKFQGSTAAIPNGTIIGVEETLRGQIIPGVPDLLARIDLLVEERDAVVIHDWKSSRSRWSPEQVDEAAEQLLLYAELVKELMPGKPLRLAFTVLTKTKEVDLTQHTLAAEPHRIDRTKRIVERVWNAIAAEHFFPAPSPLQCPSCAFQDACRAWCA